MQSIYEATFSINPSNNEGYTLTVVFTDEKKGMLSSRNFTFIQKECASQKEEVIWDVFTKNGLTNPPAPLEGLFKDTDIKEVKDAQKFLTDPSPPSVMVLDLKDKDEGYTPTLNTIAKCENAVCDFFKVTSPDNCMSRSAKKIHGLLKGKLDFIILEGTLKSDLLKAGGFTEAEITYLNSKQGAMSFCQFAEFFMNGFKLGQSAYVNGTQFVADNYIRTISNKFNVFKPFKVSTVLYPPLYQHTYSPTGKFVETMLPAFSITGDFCENTQMTRLNYEVKK